MISSEPTLRKDKEGENFSRWNRDCRLFQLQFDYVTILQFRLLQECIARGRSEDRRVRDFDDAQWVVGSHPLSAASAYRCDGP